MALFDSTLLFYHTGTAYNFTAGEFVNLTGTTGSGSLSSVVNLGNARDLGIGPGEEVPNVVITMGTGITSSSASQLVNIQFLGSTNSVLWTTYSETGYQATASFAAGNGWNFPVPRRPPGAGLPLYYALNVITGTAAGLATSSISSGTILAGIVLAPANSGGTLDQYASGFTVS